MFHMEVDMKTIIFGLLALSLSTAAPAAETISYSYDAQGRLTQVSHSGMGNNGLSTTFTHDNADNRTTVSVTGASH